MVIGFVPYDVTGVKVSVGKVEIDYVVLTSTPGVQDTQAPPLVFQAELWLAPGDTEVTIIAERRVLDDSSDDPDQGTPCTWNPTPFGKKIHISYDDKRPQAKTVDPELAAKHRATCINNLKLLQLVKQQWAAGKATVEGFEAPSMADLSYYLEPRFVTGIPVCPDDGAYSINAITSNPTCSKAATLQHAFKF